MKGQVTRIKTDEIGFPGYWFEAKSDVKLKTFREYQERIRENASQMAQADMEQFLGALVVAWNFDDDDGNQLALPKEQANIWGELPSAVYRFVIDQLSDLLQRGRSPEDSGNSSAPSGD